MSADGRNRERVLFDLSRRALEGAAPEELARLAIEGLSESLGAAEARAFADELAGLALDAERELSFSGDPGALACLEAVRAGLRRLGAATAAVRRHQMLLDHASDGLCVIDREGRYVDMNARGCQMLGYTLAELRELRIFDLVLPEEGPPDLQALRGGGHIVRRRHIRRKDGALLMAEIGSHLLPDGGIFGIFRDVADQVRTEGELRRRAERFRQALDAARAGAWEWDLTADKGFWSEETFEMLGLDPRTARASWTTWEERLHPDDRARARETFRAVLAGSSDVDVELRIVRPDGETRWLRYVGRVTRGPDGPTAIYGIQIDVEREKQAEHARAKAEGRLQQAQRMEAIGRLAGGIAHDFNNLLTVIMTGVDMIAMTADADDPSEPHVDAIREAALRGAAVTRQLLALSRSVPVEPEPLDLSAQVRRMGPMLRRLLGEDVAIEMALAGDLPVVRMDAGQLDQLVLNLAVNARDAMPRGGTITFTTTLDAIDGVPHVCLAVADTGRGMDEETRARVFEPFFTTKPPESGTGLGLATVYGIVGQSGGRIEVESELGAGSCFRAWLPAMDGRAVAAIPTRRRRQRTHCANVLLVEDERGVRRLVRRALEAAGHHVLEAADGPEAIELARTSGESFDVLVTDVVLPRMSGPELAERLRIELPHLRVLFMSGYLGDALSRHGLEVGIALIEKPFATDALLDALEQVLAAPRSSQVPSAS